LTDIEKPQLAHGVGRRTVLQSLVGAAAFAVAGRSRAATPPRMLLIHGRAQGGRAPAEIRAEWAGALQRGATAAGVAIPPDLTATLPYYGDDLDELVRQFSLPVTSRARGEAVPDDYLAFQAAVAQELQARAGVSNAEVNAQYNGDPRERGPLNWEWVQAILQALDQNAGGLSAAALEVFLRDVYLYVKRDRVRQTIDGIVGQDLTSAPTVVVGHSLGSVVAYNLLTTRATAQVPLLMTLGSPLGIRAVRDPFRPIASPRPVAAWTNAFDKRDVVALVPLDRVNFDVSPNTITNIDDIRNQTDNRHGIIGYLDKPEVVRPLLQALQNE
jgi:hypothetical protein